MNLAHFGLPLAIQTSVTVGISIYILGKFCHNTQSVQAHRGINCLKRMAR